MKNMVLAVSLTLCAAFGLDAREMSVNGTTAAACSPSVQALPEEAPTSNTTVSIRDGRWHINGRVTYPGARAEGLLMNARMVNATFEDRNPATCPKGFDPEANTDEFVQMIPDYVAHGVRAFTLSLQGGAPGYEGADNSAFAADGTLRPEYLARVQRVIAACDRHDAVVILSCYYQRQDQRLRDDAAVRAGVVNVANWLKHSGFRNVLLEIANEYGHGGFDHQLLKTTEGVLELVTLARATYPELLVSVSELGGRSGFNRGFVEQLSASCDFLLIHQNSRPLGDVAARVAGLKRLGKPIVCNEDDKPGEAGARSASECVAASVSWGLMLVDHNQKMPFHFHGAADDPAVYATLKHLTTAGDYFPPAESQGGWRTLTSADDVRSVGGMSPEGLHDLRDWLLKSDDRDFAAVVIRHGHIVLQVERGNSAVTDSRRVASVSKAVCATVLAIAAEHSQRGQTPVKMSFDDPAFGFIPQAQPLSDPRKAGITVRQLLNHTSGICPEALGAKNDGTWDYILGHTGDPRTERLAFDPGTASGYSTHAFHHASLVCESVTGKPYDQFAIESLFRPIGCEKWWFQEFAGTAASESDTNDRTRYGRHPSHALGMPARDLARIAWCMLHNGRWEGRQVIPEWFVKETASATHVVQGEEMRFKRNAQSFSHGWELPALRGESGHGIPSDARFKPGSGGQLIAFVPSLDLVVTRQTGSSGQWEYEEYLRRACAAVVPSGDPVTE